MAPGTWEWPAGLVPVAGTGLGLLPGVCGAEVVAVARIMAAAVRWWRRRLVAPVGWGSAG